MAADRASLSDRLTTHGVEAIGATVCAIRRGGARGELVGHIRRMSGRRYWEWQPTGWDGWTGDHRLMRDAVASLGDCVAREALNGGTE